MDQFRSFVIAWLERRGWSRARLSEAAEISQSLISKYLADDERHRVTPSPTSLDKLAPVLDVPYEDLMRMCGYLPGEANPKARSEIESDVLARTAELLNAVRGAPPAFWPTMIKAIYDGAIDLAEDMAAMLARAQASEDRAPSASADTAPRRRTIGGSNRRQRPIKPRHQPLALAT